MPIKNKDLIKKTILDIITEDGFLTISELPSRVQGRIASKVEIVACMRSLVESKRLVLQDDKKLVKPFTEKIVK